jgi:hypothetical protein
MKDQSKTWTAGEGFALVAVLGAFFVDIAGVCGLLLAISVMLAAVGFAVAICLKQPSEGHAQ